MSQELVERKVKVFDTTANPAPLGLMGFGMTTVLLNLHNAGFYPIDSMVLAMGMFYGGIAQIIAGIMEWKKNNTFGTTAFTSYGLFWLTLVVLILLPKTGWIPASPTHAMGAFLFMWGVFTLFMFFGTFRATKALMFVFGSLALLFFLLAARDFSENPIIGTFAGYEGIICGLSAIYLAMAQVLNEIYLKNILPVGSFNTKLLKN